jgi:hypothetical protein
LRWALLRDEFPGVNNARSSVAFSARHPSTPSPGTRRSSRSWTGTVETPHNPPQSQNPLPAVHLGANRHTTTSRVAPQPDKACDDRLWCQRRLTQGPAVRLADRRHSLRRYMMTVTQSAYVQVRCAVVLRCGANTVHSTLSRTTRKPTPDSIMTAVPSKPS